jgi:release factor glutamine methyltransferase
MNVRQLLDWGRGQLLEQTAGPLEAEILICSVLDVSRAWLYANPEFCPETAQITRYEGLIKRRARGVPIAYLTGQREFWSLSLKVTPDVLIPRPETELLVETVLEVIPADVAWRIADLGTGSGAIALALATERPRCEIHATEYSRAALRLAVENGQAIAPGRVRFHLGSWLAPLQGKFQVLVSNPPYVTADDPHLQQGDCRFEPVCALTPGRDGLAAFREIADASRRYLEKGGLLAFEHGYDQGDALRQLMSDLGYCRVETREDLEDRERVTFGIHE